jgi:xylulokinase
MATTLLGNIKNCEWDETIADSAGIPLSKLPKIHPSYEVVGEVTKKAGGKTGLKPGTPVVAGAMDTVTAAIGSNAIDPGSSFLTIGTSARLCTTVDDVSKLDDRFLNCPNTYSDRWLSISVTNCAGASLRWFRDNLAGKSVEEELKKGGNGYQALNKEAISSKPGANGLLYLPYLSGERSPIWDPYARGVLFGLSLSTERKDVARAVMEGLGYALKQTMDIWEKSGATPDKLTVSGGGANSKIWTTIIADILQHPLYKLDINETETLGSAILAGMGTGLIKDPKDVTSKMIDEKKLIEPNYKNKKIYQPMYERFNSVYENLKEDFYELEKINLMQQKQIET